MAAPIVTVPTDGLRYDGLPHDFAIGGSVAQKPSGDGAQKNPIAWARGTAVRAVAENAPDTAEEEEERKEADFEDEWRRKGYAVDPEKAAADFRPVHNYAADAADAIPSAEKVVAAYEERKLLETVVKARKAEEDQRREDSSVRQVVVEEEDEDGVNWSRMERLLGKEKVEELRAEKAKEKAKEAAKAGKPLSIPEEPKKKDKEADFLGLMSTWTHEEAPRGPTYRDVPDHAPASQRKPMTKAALKEIRALFPGSKAPPTPDEAKYWTEQDLKIFLGSDGALRPRADWDRDGVQTCPLLTQMRLKMVEDKVNKSPPEYTSLCRHIVARHGDFRRLPVAEVADVPRARRAPDPIRAPAVVETKCSWRPKNWGISWWAYEHGGALAECFSRYPPFAGERSSAAKPIAIPIDEFAKYMGVVKDMDPQCLEDQGLPFPRFFIGGWAAFASSASAPVRKLWEDDRASGRKLWAPPGVKDLTDRYIKICCDAMGLDWLETLATFDRMQIGPAGAITRLHVENNCSHSWYGQIQGRRAFILFAPKEGPSLYAKETGDPEKRSEERREHSPVDIFHPNEGKHPKFLGSRAHVAILQAGEALVVPQGWWLYSVTLESSVTLFRRFWNTSNKHGVCDELCDFIDNSTMPPAIQAQFAEKLSRLREYIERHRESDEDE